MTLLSCAGLVLIVASEAWGLIDLFRDLGISMLVAGTVGLGVELFSRREMEKILGDLIEEKMDERWKSLDTALQNVDRQGQERRRLQEDVFPKLVEIRDLVMQESGLQDVGLKRLAVHREEGLLLEFLDKAEPGSSIRVLALCLNTLANNSGRDLFKRKLRQGCQIRLLLLDPAMDTMMEERARQEGRTADEDIQEFNERVRAWNTFHKNTVRKLSTDKSSSGSIELGYYQSLPSCFLVDNGGSMVVGLYLHGCRGDQCPHLEIEHRQNGLYRQFDRHFEALWARRTSPFDQRKKDEPVENERRNLRLA